jgi:hypothetical protein
MNYIVCPRDNMVDLGGFALSFQYVGDSGERKQDNWRIIDSSKTKIGQLKTTV